MTEINHVSPSMLDTWAKCRLLFFFEYLKRLTPLGRNFHFDLGTGVHEALAAYYKRGDDPVQVFDDWMTKEKQSVLDLIENDDPLLGRALEEDVDTLTEAHTLGLQMLKGYVEHYKNERLEVLQVEKTVLRPVPGTDFDLECRIDTLVRDLRRHKQVYVLEHKTFSRFYLDYLAKDHQFVAEKWAAETLVDEPVAGVIYNGLRKQNPSRTSLALFERHAIDINDEQVRHLHKRFRDFYRTLLRGKLSIYPEPSPISCGGCTFKEPCGLYIRGEDYQFCLDNLFTSRSTTYRERYK